MYDDIEATIPEVVKASMRHKPEFNFLKNQTGKYEAFETNPHCLKSIRYKHVKPVKRKRDKPWKITSNKPKLLEYSLKSYPKKPNNRTEQSPKSDQQETQ